MVSFRPPPTAPTLSLCRAPGPTWQSENAASLGQDAPLPLPTTAAGGVRKTGGSRRDPREPVNAILASGSHPTYNNASEVVRDALRELQRRQHADQLTEIRARIGAGLDQLDRGEGRSGKPAAVLGDIVRQAKRQHPER